MHLSFCEVLLSFFLLRLLAADLVNQLPSAVSYNCCDCCNCFLSRVRSTQSSNTSHATNKKCRKQVPGKMWHPPPLVFKKFIVYPFFSPLEKFSSFLLLSSLLTILSQFGFCYFCHFFLSNTCVHVMPAGCRWSGYTKLATPRQPPPSLLVPPKRRKIHPEYCRSSRNNFSFWAYKCLKIYETRHI